MTGGLMTVLGILDVLDVHVVPRHPAFKVIWDQFYVLPTFTWQTWVSMTSVVFLVLALHGAYCYALDYQRRFERLIEHKLVFEIDLRHTKIQVTQTKSALRIFLDLQLRFENKDSPPLSMKGLNITLHRLGIKDVRPAADISTLLGILRISSNGVPIKTSDFEGMTVQGPLTPFYMIDAMIAIEGDEHIKSAEDLDVTDFLRVSMQSSGYQPEFTARLHPDWKAALKGRGTSQIIVTGASFISEDYRRIDA